MFLWLNIVNCEDGNRKISNFATPFREKWRMEGKKLLLTIFTTTFTLCVRYEARAIACVHYVYIL